MCKPLERPSSSSCTSSAPLIAFTVNVFIYSSKPIRRNHTHTSSTVQQETDFGL